jgi:glycosyltransferase involved in cell wall biosynthesis
VLEEIERHECVTVLNIGSNGLDRSRLTYHLVRVLRVLRAAAIILLRGGRSRKFYMSSESTIGLYYMLLLVTCARIRRDSIFLHYHSFTFVDLYSPVMWWIVQTAGKDALHIFLCPRHRDRFASLYPIKGRAEDVTNAWILPPHPAADRVFSHRKDGELTIGLISHLGREKGLYEFLSLVRCVAGEHLPIRAILAGPPVSSEDRAAIDVALAECGQMLEFRGPVYDADKVRFFQDIDVLIFPTRFAVETQPMVMFESFSHGCPVIAYGRGCMPDDAVESGSLILSPDVEFIEPALEKLRTWLANPNTLQSGKALALECMHRHHAASFAGINRLIAALTG